MTEFNWFLRRSCVLKSSVVQINSLLHYNPFWREILKRYR